MFVPKKLKNPMRGSSTTKTVISNWVPIIDESRDVVTSDGMDNDVHMQ